MGDIGEPKRIRAEDRPTGSPDLLSEVQVASSFDHILLVPEIPGKTALEDWKRSSAEIILPESPPTDYVLTTTQMAQVDPIIAREQLIAAFGRVNEAVIGREPLLNQTIIALLNREHQLIFSRAGLAKSLYAMSVFGQFEGASSFEIQLTKGTTEEALVGAIDIEQLKRGNVIHNTQGTIVDANFAYLDEIFDASDVALRSLLSILNERVYRNGKQVVDAQLHTAIATANFMRVNDITEAVLDRFPFKAYLTPDTDPYNLLRIDGAFRRNAGRVAKPGQGEKVPFNYVQKLADIVEGKDPSYPIEVPSHVLFLKNLIALSYQEKVNEQRGKANPARSPLYISPRTLAKAREVLNASVLLNGRSAASIDDLDALRYIFCEIGNPNGEEALFDQALGEVKGMSKKDITIVDAVMEASELLEVILDKVRRGEQVDKGLIDRIKKRFKVQSMRELTVGTVKSPIEKLSPTNPVVQRLKESFLKRVNEEGERMSSGGNSLVNF